MVSPSLVPRMPSTPSCTTTAMRLRVSSGSYANLRRRSTGEHLLWRTTARNELGSVRQPVECGREVGRDCCRAWQEAGVAIVESRGLNRWALLLVSSRGEKRRERRAAIIEDWVRGPYSTALKALRIGQKNG